MIRTPLELLQTLQHMGMENDSDTKMRVLVNGVMHGIETVETNGKRTWIVLAPVDLLVQPYPMVRRSG